MELQNVWFAGSFGLQLFQKFSWLPGLALLGEESVGCRCMEAQAHGALPLIPKPLWCAEKPFPLWDNMNRVRFFHGSPNLYSAVQVWAQVQFLVFWISRRAQGQVIQVWSWCTLRNWSSSLQRLSHLKEPFEPYIFMETFLGTAALLVIVVLVAEQQMVFFPWNSYLCKKCKIFTIVNFQHCHWPRQWGKGAWKVDGFCFV